jgi:hypothetical protein
MRILFLTLILWIVVLQKSNAQYISRSEPDPSFNCPVICQGGTLQLKVFQIQNFPAGTQIQALLSNANGSFASGTQILPVNQYSNNNGSSWTNGPYLFSSNINDLLIRVVIPVSTPIGSAYTIKMRASTGYISNDLFQCSGGNVINVIPANVPLPAVAQTQSGNGQWIGHVYTWTPTTSSALNSPSLIASQDFFNTVSVMESYRFGKITGTVGVNLTMGNIGESKFQSLSSLNSYRTIRQSVLFNLVNSSLAASNTSVSAHAPRSSLLMTTISTF